MSGGSLGVGPYAGKRDEVFKEWPSGSSANIRTSPLKLGEYGMPSLMGFEMGQQDKAPSSEQLASLGAISTPASYEAFG